MKRHNNSIFNPSTELLFETYWTNVKRKHGNSPLAIHRNSPSRTRVIELIRDTIRPIIDCLGWIPTDLSRLDSFIFGVSDRFRFSSEITLAFIMNWWWICDEWGCALTRTKTTGSNWQQTLTMATEVCMFVCVTTVGEFLLCLCYHSCFLNKNSVIIKKLVLNETPY